MNFNGATKHPVKITLKFTYCDNQTVISYQMPIGILTKTPYIPKNNESKGTKNFVVCRSSDTPPWNKLRPQKIGKQ